jgi:ribosome-binding protein aMBF1 (putative translation factor)
METETGLHRATISRIERGDLQPNVHHLLVLGRALGIKDLIHALERFTDE